MKFHTEEQKLFDHCCFLPTISHKLCETFTVASCAVCSVIFYFLFWLQFVCMQKKVYQQGWFEANFQIIHLIFFATLLLCNVLMNLFSLRSFCRLSFNRFGYMCAVVLFFFCFFAFLWNEIGEIGSLVIFANQSSYLG